MITDDADIGHQVTGGAITDSTEYLSEPQVEYLGGEEFLVCYRSGGSHAGDSSGRLVYIKSYDGGETWTSEQVIRSTNVDNRNPSLGQDPGSGDLILFGRDCDGNTTDVYLYTSTDSGETWNGPTSVYNELSNASQALPFGGVIETSAGLITLFHREGDQNSLLQSPDGGQSWGNEIDLFDPADMKAGELFPVTMSEAGNRVLAIGTNTETRKSMYVRSDDGGLIWGTPQNFSIARDTKAVINGELTAHNEITFAWADRDTMDVFAAQLPTTTVWDDPTVIRRASRQVIATSDQSDILDFGYPTVTRAGSNHPQSTLVCWYADDNGPDIYLSSLTGGAEADDRTQFPQDVSSKRSFDTWYKNDTGRRLEYSVTVITNAGTSGDQLIGVGEHMNQFPSSDTWPINRTILRNLDDTESVTLNRTVPRGAYYKIVEFSGNDAVIDSWMEYR